MPDRAYGTLHGDLGIIDFSIDRVQVSPKYTRSRAPHTAGTLRHSKSMCSTCMREEHTKVEEDLDRVYFALFMKTPT